MTSKCTRTILRIKRRRTEEPLPYIRLEGLDGRMKRPRGDTNDEIDSQHLSELLDNADLNNNEEKEPCRSSVVWKRLTPEANEKQSYRIVDALLEEDGRMTKRRKLTLLETSSETEFPSVVSVRRKTPFKVLDPLNRLVDDSLQEVHAGTKRVMEHYRFVTTDRRLAFESNKWLVWCHSSGGNILHACALWNDVEVANDILQLPLGSSLTEEVDGDGRTPYEVAQLSGHDSVCEILEAFGGDSTNYVYDIFCLEEGESEKVYEEQPMSVELTAGVGYWTPDGELVLEAPEKSSASLNHVFDEDGEIDSNCEEYGGNDYPDEDEDWGEDFVPDQAYRNHPVELYREESDSNDLEDGVYELSHE